MRTVPVRIHRVGIVVCIVVSLLYVIKILMVIVNAGVDHRDERRPSRRLSPRDIGVDHVVHILVVAGRIRDQGIVPCPIRPIVFGRKPARRVLILDRNGGVDILDRIQRNDVVRIDRRKRIVEVHTGDDGVAHGDPGKTQHRKMSVEADELGVVRRSDRVCFFLACRADENFVFNVVFAGDHVFQDSRNVVLNERTLFGDCFFAHDIAFRHAGESFGQFLFGRRRRFLLRNRGRKQRYDEQHCEKNGKQLFSSSVHDSSSVW